MTTPTDEQRAVIESDAANIAVIAGPGSGKTTTLVARLRHDLGLYDPAQMAVITFTNAAAQHLRDKLKDEVTPPAYIGTLHGWALAFLRRGANPKLTVADEETAEAVLAEVIKALKVRGITTTAIREALGEVEPVDSMPPKISLVIRAYAQRLAHYGLTDFDLLLRECWQLLTTSRFSGVYHLYVDEVQDSGDMDMAIYDAMKPLTRFMVGDPDQSIYAFRGGKPAHLLNYAQRPDVATFYLQENYRSSSEICLAANTLIGHNAARLEKLTFSKSGPAFNLLVQEVPTDQDELALIGVMLRTTAVPWGQCAVLVRYNADRKAIVDHLKKLDIAVHGEGESTPGWREMTALVQALASPSALTWAAYDAALGRGKLLERLSYYLSAPFPPVELDVEPTWISFYSAAATAKIPAAAISRLNAMRVKLGAKIIFDLPALLLAMREPLHPPPANAVTVTTYHGAKGLEWEFVILPCLHRAALTAKGAAIEEERRLVFVGITRAKRWLSLVYPLSRTNPHSKHVERTDGPSPFIAESGLSYAAI